MPSILDSRAEIKKLDKSNLLGSVEAFGDQVTDAIAQFKEFQIPSSYQNIKNVILAGMGGSALGGHVVKSLFKGEFKVPYEIVSGYDLPGYVNNETLVILSSYSGTTEETLSCSKKAIDKGCLIAAIASGATLADQAREHGWPLYLINPTFNPCNQPRMAVGYAIVGLVMMLVKFGLLPDISEELGNFKPYLTSIASLLNPESDQSIAKSLAFHLYEKSIIFVAAEHLIGSAHVMNNQINENGKALTSEWHLPEFNHHYMEALSFPRSTHDDTVYLMFNSHLYTERIQKRVLLTKSLLEQKGYEVQMILAEGKTKLEQAFELIQIGEYVGFYLSMLYGIDPSPIPNVDWFKSEMAK